jgi:hypothetical protein
MERLGPASEQPQVDAPRSAPEQRKSQKVFATRSSISHTFGTGLDCVYVFACRNEADYGLSAGSVSIGRAHFAATTDAQSVAVRSVIAIIAMVKRNLGPPCKDEMPVSRPASMPVPTGALREEVEAAIDIHDVDTAGVEARSAVAVGDIAIIAVSNDEVAA